MTSVTSLYASLESRTGFHPFGTLALSWVSGVAGGIKVPIVSLLPPVFERIISWPVWRGFAKILVVPSVSMRIPRSFLTSLKKPGSERWQERRREEPQSVRKVETIVAGMVAGS